jgi:hypothetical protein
MREWYKKNPDKALSAMLRRPGRGLLISLEDYRFKLQEQNNTCAICGKAETHTHKGVPRRLCVDHDHKTGVIRELLCSQCNKGVGQFNDDPILMRAMANYVEHHK